MDSQIRKRIDFSSMNNESVKDYAKQRRSNINARAKETNLLKFLH